MISQKHQTVCNVNRYKEYKTKLNRLLKKCERDYYDEKFESYKNDLRKSWNLIKEVINKKRVQGTFNTFIINDEETCDKQTIVEAFNKFYSSIGPKLASKIPGSDISPTSYIANSNPETICLIPVSQEEVSKIILVLNDSSAGWDNIYSKIVKQTYQHILPMLTHLFNLSITKGIVPKELKIGKVFPIYKNENCMLVNNFRPVSVLPLFSKILERLMYSRILSFF